MRGLQGVVQRGGCFGLWCLGVGVCVIVVSDGMWSRDCSCGCDLYSQSLQPGHGKIGCVCDIEACTHDSLLVTLVVFVLHWLCLCYTGCVCVTLVVFVLHWLCLCYNTWVCVTVLVFVLQALCLCNSDE